MVGSSFGQLLRQARLARGFSQSAAAAPALTKAYISLLEHDGARPSAATLFHLADRLARPLGYFLAALDPKTVLRTLRVLEQRAETALRQRRYPAAQSAYDDLRALAERHALPALRIRGTLGVGEALLGLRQIVPAEGLLREAFEGGRHSEDRLAECRALAGLGLAAHRQGRLTDAVAHYRAALALIPTLLTPAPVLHGEILAYLSTMLFRLGSIEESLAAATESLALLERHALDRTPEVRMNLGFAHYSLGEYDLASSQYREALRVAEQFEDLQTGFRVRKNWAMVLLESGQHDAALQQLELSMTMARRLADAAGECQALTELARCRVLMGAHGEAHAVAEQAVAQSRTAGLLDEAARAGTVLGVVSLAQRQPQRAMRYLAESYRHCVEAGMLFDGIVAGHALARATARWGKAADAVRVYNEVFEALRRLSAEERYGVMRMTRTLDTAIDPVLGAPAASVASPVGDAV